MKTLLLTLLLFACINVNSQPILHGTAGISTTKIPTITLAGGYEFNNFPVVIGYSRNITDRVEVKEWIFTKVGYMFYLTDNSYITTNAGWALMYWKKEVWTGTDPLYSHFKRIAVGKPLFSVEYLREIYGGLAAGAELTKVGEIYLIGFTFKQTF